MNKEELEYILETIRFKTSIYRDKKKRNLSFNDDDYYSNILNEYITNLQQENARLKDKLIEINEVINGYMPNQYAMCKAFDEIEFIISKGVE